MVKKKVLIFGLGRQGKKYYHYFKQQDYFIVGVNKSGKTTLFLEEIYSFETILEKEKQFFQRFHYIILSVFPIFEQDNVIRLLMSHHVKESKYIVEKPVSYDHTLFQELVKQERWSFFMDEMALSNIYKKIFPNMDEVSMMISSDLGKDERNHILEHAFGGFLGHDNFSPDSVSLIFSDRYKADITHFCIYNRKYNLVIRFSDIYLNKKKIGSIHFSQKMKMLESLYGSNKRNILYKNNFYKLNVFLYK